MSLTRIIQPIFLCALAGCGASSLPNGQSPDSPDVPVTAQAPARAGKRAPIQLSLTGPSAPKAGEALTLTAEVRRNLRLDVPMDLELRLPTGVTLLEGDAIQQLLPSSEPDTRTLRFVIVADAIPDTDATLVLDARGQGFGFHTEQTYRFGRSEPALKAGAPLGADLKLGKRNAGPSVELAPKTQK